MSNGLSQREKRHFIACSGDVHEKLAWRQNLTLVGVDEVGRGCLAGPLVAAAVELPKWATRSGNMPILRDSKCMTERQRLIAYQWIATQCRYGVGVIHLRGIDRFNIWGATLQAMQRAIFGLLATRPTQESVPGSILVDAMPVDLLRSCYAAIPIQSFPRAEQASLSVAAASILAKVWRDELMAQLDTHFPAYGLAGHKGYATKIHRAAVLRDGHSLIHRLSFLRKKSEKQEGDRGEQVTIF